MNYKSYNNLYKEASNKERKNSKQTMVKIEND